ncbi:MAG: hypothetical protein NTW96_08930 [Planctomycetia bacterium]|nr:hypothetical protein [Planctomycetia bacterium]
MSKGKAVTLAVFTVWPFLYMILFMCMIFGMMISDFSGGGPSSGPPTIIMIIFPLHFLTMLDIFALLVIYIVHLFKTDKVPQDKKALWAVVLSLGNMVAMPIYWYLYIWREHTRVTPGGAAHPQRRAAE